MRFIKLYAINTQISQRDCVASLFFTLNLFIQDFKFRTQGLQPGIKTTLNALGVSRVFPFSDLLDFRLKGTKPNVFWRPDLVQDAVGAYDNIPVVVTRNSKESLAAHTTQVFPIDHQYIRAGVHFLRFLRHLHKHVVRDRDHRLVKQAQLLQLDGSTYHFHGLTSANRMSCQCVVTEHIAGNHRRLVFHGLECWRKAGETQPFARHFRQHHDVTGAVVNFSDFLCPVRVSS